MFRNQYDNDNTTWSPQGRIHQIEYAMEAVKQGSAAVGLRSKNFAVLLTLKRSASELASYQKKLIRVDDHVGIAFAGLTSDARVLSNFMRTECMRSRMLFNRPLPVFRLVSAVADKAQVNTQRYGNRPYGVGILSIGYDESGPHLYECSPSGNFFDYTAMSIGARSQSAKTYLEKYYKEFETATLDQLIVHGLRALRDTLQQDKELNIHNCSIGIVGNDPDAPATNDTENITPITISSSSSSPIGSGFKKFHVVEGEGLQRYLDLLAESDAATGGPSSRRGNAAAAAATATTGEAAMETDTSQQEQSNAMETD